MNYISIKNLNMNYNNNVLFKNISFEIKKGSIVAITTPSSSGKTTLLNIISSHIKTTDNVFIEGAEINKKIKSEIPIFNKHVDFYCKTVLEELLLVSIDIIKIKNYLKTFNLTDYINLSPQVLTFVQKQKLLLIKSLLRKDKVILIDNIFSYFDKYSKIEFIGYLRKYEKYITVIYTTNNLEDAIFADKIIIIDKEIIYDGQIDKIYQDDKILKKSKLNIPLEKELVEKLNLYSIVDSANYTIEEVVDEICK